MSSVTIWSNARGLKPAKASAVLPDFEFPSFKLELDDKVLDALETDKSGERVAAYMVEDAQAVYEEYRKAVQSALGELDEACQRKGIAKDEVAKRAKNFESKLSGHTKNVEAALTKVPGARWDKWVSTKKEYKSYQIKAGVKVGVAVLGTVGAGLSLAAAVPTGGATLALSIVGGLRAIAGLATQIKNLALDVEKVEKLILFDLGALTKAYQKGGKKALAAASGAMVTVQAVFAVDIGPSLKSINGNCGLWKSKVQGLDVAAGKLAGEALDALKKADALENTLAKAKPKDLDKALKKIQRLRKGIDEGLDGANKLSARIKTAEANYDKLIAPALKVLLDAQPGWHKKFEQFAPGLVGLGLAFGGGDYGEIAKGSLDGVKGAIELGNEVLGYVQDVSDS
jgi:hypothetical protein